MSFLHPEFLYYMLIPLFILFGLLLTQKESQEHFFSNDVMDKLRVSANTLTLKARNALFLLMAIFMIIALAQPVIKDGVVEVKAKSADIMIALDISDSMLATDVYPSRLQLAKQKALTLLDESPNERIGIIAFAKNSYLVSPLSFDTSAVAFLLRQLDTSSITEKGTDFESVLNIVIQTQKEQEKKYLLVLSDGGDKSDFSDEIELAKANGVKVFVLAIATKKGAPIKQKDGTFIKHNGDIIISKLNENIADLATKTGGVYIQGSTSDKDIKTMFQEISSKSDERELKSEEIPRYTELFYYPVAMALLLLLIAMSSFGKVERLSGVVVLSLLFLSNPQKSEAGMLDFMELDKAKKAYESGKYEESAKLYENFANKSSNGQGHYNAGNSYYKQKDYKKAIESYKKATFDKDEARAKNYSNLGNAYAKSNALEKAVESYEKSLKIQDDKETKENLEAVKKMIEKQKQKNQDQKDGDDKNKDDKNKEANKDKSEQKKKDSDENQQKSSDDKEKSKNEKNSSKSKDSKDKEQNKDDMKSKNEKENKKDKSEKSKERKDKLDKLDEQKKDKNNSKGESASEMKQHEMSEAEEKKWLKHLNTDSKTYMYKLDNKKPYKPDPDEKPW